MLWKRFLKTFVWGLSSTFAKQWKWNFLQLVKINIFELRIFSFNSYIYYLTCGFIASTRASNLVTRAFNLPTCTFSVPARAFNLATPAFNVLTRGFELLTRGFELLTRGFELVTHGFELVTHNSCFTFSHNLGLMILGNEELFRVFTWVFIDMMILELVDLNS